MLYQAMDTRFIIEMVVGLLLGVATWAWSLYEYRGSPERSVRTTYFTTPANSALSTVGIIIPALAGLFTFLYSTSPGHSYSSLLAAIAFFFMVLLLAVWLTFSLMKKAKADENITLRFPKDRRFITSIGLMQVFLLISLLYLAIFLLVELPVPARKAPGTALLAKSMVKVGQTRSEVEHLWGTPSSSSSITEYKNDRSTFRLFFDASGRLGKIENIKEEQ